MILLYHVLRRGLGTHCSPSHAFENPFVPVVCAPMRMSSMVRSQKNHASLIAYSFASFSSFFMRFLSCPSAFSMMYSRSLILSSASRSLDGRYK